MRPYLRQTSEQDGYLSIIRGPNEGRDRPIPKILLDIETPAALCNPERIADVATLVDGMMIGVTLLKFTHPDQFLVRMGNRVRNI